jgi:hypothetical protein
MLPRDLKAEDFQKYPQDARKLAVNSISALRRLPLSFLPNLLREVIEYDCKFPVERVALTKELDDLGTLSEAQVDDLFGPFARIALSPRLENFDWVNSPAQFVEQLSAHLWTTHQLDAFRVAANRYADHLNAVTAAEEPSIPRLGISIIGQGVGPADQPLFRKLRPHGTYFNRIKPDDGLRLLLDAVAARAKAQTVPYGHWYIDGGEAADHDSSITCVSYGALESVRAALLARVHAEIEQPGMGPETLRTIMAGLRPADLGMSGGDKVLQRFEVKLLTEGSGTQLFSTSFAQWAAREALRRARPMTLLVRFAPRQRQKPMNELLSSIPGQPDVDVLGSLVDADMGAYYNWLNQQRLPGARDARFLVWFEGYNSALAIGPSMSRGTESESNGDLKKLLTWLL